MCKKSVDDSFDFTASFQRTLDRFDTLGGSSKIDYERSREENRLKLTKNPPDYRTLLHDKK